MAQNKSSSKAQATKAQAETQVNPQEESTAITTAPATPTEAIVTPETTQPGAIITAELPPLDSPAIGAPEPVRSFKPPFNVQEANSWMVSEDAGQTKRVAGTLVLAGLPHTLRLEVSEASWKEGWTDYRLRFMFTNQQGELEELNLNAINPSKNDEGRLVITGPARSLLGALMACSDSADDAYCFSQGVRMTLKAGSQGSAFIDLDVVGLDSQGSPTWVAMAGPQNTKRIRQGVRGLIDAVEVIQSRLSGLGVLQPGLAVVGEIPEQQEAAPMQVVPVEAVSIPQEEGEAES